MKKLILSSFLVGICFISFAQVDSSLYKKNQNKEKMYDDKVEPQIGRQPDQTDTLNTKCAVSMVNGKVMITTDGKLEPVNKEVRTANGNVVMPDGTIKMADGNTFQMKNGDCLDISGKMVAIKNSSKKEEAKGSK